MGVDSAVVGMTGDQNISEKEEKKIKKIVDKKKQRSVNLRMKFWCLQIFQSFFDRFLP